MFLGVTKALKRMNGKMNLPQLQKIMMEFERESEIMDLKEETISDTIDDVLGEGDEEEVCPCQSSNSGCSHGQVGVVFTVGPVGVVFTVGPVGVVITSGCSM